MWPKRLSTSCCTSRSSGCGRRVASGPRRPPSASASYWSLVEYTTSCGKVYHIGLYDHWSYHFSPFHAIPLRGKPYHSIAYHVISDDNTLCSCTTLQHRLVYGTNAYTQNMLFDTGLEHVGLCCAAVYVRYYTIRRKMV